jgi:hypothetical protein
MDQSLIGWMMYGGERAETREDQRRRAHLIALRESQGSRTGSSVRQLLARWTDRPAVTAGADLTTDCCAA